MKLKHKLIKEFQYLGDDKKIIILKVGTILEEYIYKLKSELIPIDKDIVDSNPDFFEIVEWKAELLSYLKSNKIPQPAILSKKLYPFMEEFILNNETNSSKIESNIVINEDLISKRELDIQRREKRVIENEDDNAEKLKRIQNREDIYKENIKQLDEKENDLLLRISKITERELNLEDALREINERERNLENEILNSSQDIEGKYKELKEKIDTDLLDLDKKEAVLSKKEKELSNLETLLNQKESDISDEIRDFEIRLQETKEWEAELHKLSEEINNWESLHWKFQRNNKPPSCI
jgi:DNA repair exonuclease SbcCD ATPase subunit